LASSRARVSAGIEETTARQALGDCRRAAGLFLAGDVLFAASATSVIAEPGGIGGGIARLCTSVGDFGGVVAATHAVPRRWRAPAARPTAEPSRAEFCQASSRAEPVRG